MDNQQEVLDREIVFKGCTRPAMIMGVPIVPFVLGVGSSFVLLFLLLSPPWTILSIVVWWVMRMMAKEDDQRFRLLWIELITIRFNPNKRIWGVASFQPVAYREKKKK